MVKRLLTVLLAVAFVAGTMGWSQLVSAGPEGKLPSKSDKSCLKCHQYDKQANVLAGKLASVSRKAKTIQLQIGKEMEVIHFDDKTVLKNAPTFKKIPKKESVKIIYAKRDGKTYATQVVVKKGIKVSKEQLATVEEVAKLVAQGPEKGKYVLIDSRPAPMYDQGHVPTAKKMPFFAFDKLKDKVLPKDKEVLQIYYCAGFS